MSHELTIVEDDSNSLMLNTKEFVTMHIGKQFAGLPILQAQDVLNPLPITKVPLSGNDVRGLLNLRGRIVTAIDVNAKLGMQPLENIETRRSIVVEHNDELYALYVDNVGDVMSLPESNYEQNPANLDERWISVSNGVFRLDNQIMIALDINKLLDY